MGIQQLQSSPEGIQVRDQVQLEVGERLVKVRSVSGLHEPNPLLCRLRTAEGDAIPESAAAMKQVAIQEINIKSHDKMGHFKLLLTIIKYGL